MAVTVHDVSFRRDPAWFSRRDRLVLNTGVRTTLRRAAAVITISSFSRSEISRFYRIPQSSIHVTHLAPADAFRDRGRPAPDQAGKFAGLKPYVLAVGNLQPRKNLARLAEAFAGVCRRGAPHRLVISGKTEWKESDVYSAIRAAGIEDRVLLPGYVPDADLPALYRDADVFVFPSLYEGFGLPVLEAMACGTPVVCSNAASLPEVAGDAAVMADPCDTGAMENAIMRVVSDPDLRASLRAKGLARVAEFSWRRTAEETLAIYRSIPRR
jgi:glycosyltransferase involved in cell wall biosynthesis